VAEMRIKERKKKRKTQSENGRTQDEEKRRDEITVPNLIFKLVAK
jgi:hypothetical protein